MTGTVPGQVEIEWAIVVGKRSHIGEFKGIPPGKRPPATCERCLGEMIMSLGRYKAHHFRHLRGVECGLCGGPETRLHFNAVRRLGHWLDSKPILLATVRCTGDRCEESNTEQIALEWDAAIVEAKLPGVGPDILLHRDTRSVLAIEVRATHSVSREKAEAYARLGIPWIEVEASFIAEEWTPGEALRVVEQRGALTSFICDVHAERERIISDGRAPKCVHPTPAPDLGTKWKFRIVDWYPPDGFWIRLLYWMHRTEEDGGWVVRIIGDTEIDPIVSVGPEPVLEKAYRRAVGKFGRLLASRRKTLDSPMEWLDASRLPSMSARKSRFPPRRQRATAFHEWRGHPDYGDIQWPADIDNPRD
jgi:hypothetical protein